MDEPNDLQRLTAQVAKLVEKLDAPPKKKEWTERLTVFSSFFSTVIIALLGLYFTQSSHRAEVAIQQAQVRIEEMTALTSIAPLLASRDSAQRAVAQTILDAVDDSKRAVGGASRGAPAAGRGASPVAAQQAAAAGPASLSLLDNFIRRAKDGQASEAMRIAALRQIQAAATSPQATPAVRNQALGAASELAVAPGVPEGVRQAATDVIAGIQSVPPGQIAQVIERAPLRRAVNEIVVHHSALPMSTFRGTRSILAMARVQLGERGWSRVSWHYAIAPDGTVWLGMPLDQRAIHAQGHNENSAAVLLLLDGDRELPTPEQQRVFGLVMRTLQHRVGLSPDRPEAARRHADFPEAGKSCPGRLITQELINAWIRGA